MPTKYFVSFVVIVSFGASLTASPQNPGYLPGKGTTLRPTIYTTRPKTFTAQLKNDGQDGSGVEVNLSLTVTAANSDDTIAGTVNFTIPDEARQKIAADTGKALGEVPNVMTRKDAIARFAPATAPPIIHLLIDPLEMEVDGIRLHFGRMTFDIPARQGSETTYTTEEIEALITVWARQIADGRPRRGVISRLKSVIAGL